MVRRALKMVSKRLQRSAKSFEFADFQWTRPAVQSTSGFCEWVDGEPAKQAGSQSSSERRWLVPRVDPSQVSPYRPLADYPALFRTFVDTPATECGFRDFFLKYGLPGLQMPFVRLAAGQRGRALGSGVSLDKLEREHRALTRVVNTWKALESPKQPEAPCPGSDSRARARSGAQGDNSP
jgi:hypothetical protein